MITNDGRSFYGWTEEDLTADHGSNIIGALGTSFGEKQVILFDRVRYFYAKEFQETVSGTRVARAFANRTVERVQNETLQARYFPPRFPELYPIEQCWNQLDLWFNYWLIGDVEWLKSVLLIALEEFSEPNVVNYLLPHSSESDRDGQSIFVRYDEAIGFVRPSWSDGRYTPTGRRRPPAVVCSPWVNLY